MITEVPAHHARATLKIEGRPYDVIEVEGEESLNLGYLLEVALLAPPHQRSADFLGHRFQLELRGRDGDTRQFAGVVTKVIENLNPAERKRFTLRLRPQFRHLELNRGPVLWIGLDFKGLARTLLHEAGAGPRVEFAFNSTHPVRPWLLRGFDESALEMLQRHMTREAIFCWVDVHEGEERLVFADHNAYCPYVPGGALREVPELGLEALADGHPQVGVYAIEDHHVLQPGAAIGYVTPPQGPVRPLAGEPRACDRPGLISGFGIANSLGEAERWAKLRDEYHDQQAHCLHIRANRVDLAPGHCLTLESALHAGDYLVTAVRHRTAQAAGQLARGATLPYTCEAWLIPRARPYHGACPLKREQPDIFEARLVSNSPYASLDAQGRYRIRTLFEPGIHPFEHTPDPDTGLPRLRRLSPHGGPLDPRGQPTGWHAPGLDDAPVFLSCLNDDPDQLFILGGSYDPRQRSPVTCSNPTENLYRSVNGNTLLMDDRQACEAVRLHPIEGRLYLELNATQAGQWVGLETKEGAIEQKAGKLIAFKSGDTHEEQVNNDRIQQVENRSITQTRKGKIHHQAGRDIQLAAGDSIRLEAGQDVAISAGNNLVFTAEEDAVFQINRGDQLIRVNRGEVQIQAAGDIRIEGDGSGPITLVQNDGGVQIGTRGEMTFFGQAFSADFDQINMDGEVNYEVLGGDPAPQLSLRDLPEPTPIEDLVDPREPVDKRVEQETVALVPVRYAIDQRAEGEQAYAYSAAQLAKDLPPLEQAKYVLRRPRTGWLYLVLNNRLYTFEIDANASLIPETAAQPALEAARINTKNQALLLPKSAGAVWLAYSEHLWTEKQRHRIESNEGGCRNRQMQRFALDAPGKDAFELSELPTQVADYGGPGGDFAWSDSPPQHFADKVADLQNELIHKAEAGQQGVALHDPIGISHDLTALIEANLEALQSYFSAPVTGANKEIQENYRLRIIAEQIQALYKGRYSAETDAATLAELRREHWRAEPAHRGKPEPGLDHFYRQVHADDQLNPALERYSKHVKEAERLAFLDEFYAGLTPHLNRLDSWRQDRLAWLASWNLLTQPQWLGAAWDSFDFDDKADWQHFEHSFARSSASLIGMAANRKEGLDDRALKQEIALVGQWLSAPEALSPISRALYGHTELYEQTKHYLAQQERERRDTEKLKAPQQSDTNPLVAAYDTAADRTGNVEKGSADIAEAICQRFPHTLGTETIVHTLTAYTLTRPAGMTRKMVNGLQKSLETTIKTNGLARALAFLSARYQDNLSEALVTEDSKTHLRRYPQGNIPSSGVTRTSTSVEGRLRQGKTTLKHQETRVEHKAIFGKGVDSPIRGYGTGVVTGFAMWLYMVNLKRAIEDLDSENRMGSGLNLLSAIAAVGGGINSGLDAYKTISPGNFAALKASSKLVELMARKTTTRFFGYAGAALDFLTDSWKSGQLISEGDTDAGLYYAGSAVTIGIGGAAMTYGFTGGALLLGPIGWIALGVVLTGASIALTLTGESKKDDAVEKWLDACSFGNRDHPEAPNYQTLEEELYALGLALHTPTLLDSDWTDKWGWPDYKAEAEIFLPGYIGSVSQLHVRANGKHLGPYVRSDGMDGAIAKLRFFQPKDEGVEQVRFELRYRPDERFDKDFTLNFTVPESEEKSENNDPRVSGP